MRPTSPLSATGSPSHNDRASRCATASGTRSSGNIVTGGRTSIYLRGATVSVKRNTLTDANMHAVTLVGNLGSTQVTENTISGCGPSAIDAKRADGVTMDRWQNDDDHWHDTTPFFVTLKKFLQPLTALWMALGCCCCSPRPAVPGGPGGSGIRMSTRRALATAYRCQ